MGTKHGKEQCVSRPFLAALGAMVHVPSQLDTDLLGTFTGEVPRIGSPKEVASRKARLAMQALAEPLGTANEGSFGPHPQFPWIYADLEIMVFVDEERGMELSESFFTTDCNFAHYVAATADDLEEFLHNAKFPSHALIVRPNDEINPAWLFKGIVEPKNLRSAIEACTKVSNDGLARIETDMRAHLNPTRRRAIRRAAFRLVRRIATHCPSCSAPGWGFAESVPGLPCSDCGLPTTLVKHEVHRCWRCTYETPQPRRDGRRSADPRDCQQCNP